jgi:SpoVK/Ycf46/Vps4 family AAA+-type ATPase
VSVPLSLSLFLSIDADRSLSLSLRIVVIASTNRPFDLDEAVLRRLPRRIMVDLPSAQSRRDILAVTLANNRLAAEVNLTRLAEQLEGYSGSDLKEVCREAVVRIAHERAQKLEGRLPAPAAPSEAIDEPRDEDDDAEVLDMHTPLRPVSAEDFAQAMQKLKASVSENSRELEKVVEWNERYGEIKRSRRSPQSLNMYV